MTLLQEKIHGKSAVIGVIGLGYVGLPLALASAKVGFRVIGFDVSSSKVEMLNLGKSYVDDIKSEDLGKCVASKKLSATTNFALLKSCDIILICVPTPLNEFKQPDLSFVEDATKSIRDNIKSDILVILESTTYPGTTEDLVSPILESTGLKVGKDFFLAFSPERVDPGNPTFKTENTTKIVGGCTPMCTTVTKDFYQAILDAPVFSVSSPKEAEATKILENTYRLVNCALANEMAILCNRMGINIWEVIQAASTKPFGFMPFYPGPGVGGHCIPLDPFYLSYKAKQYKSTVRLIDIAGELNDTMPLYVVQRAMDLLNGVYKSMNGSKILVCGMAYKGDISDVRESPSLDVWQLLVGKGADVHYYDPYSTSVNICGKKHFSVEFPEKGAEEDDLSIELIKSFDLVLITTAHRKLVNYEFILKYSQLIFDTKNVIAPLLNITQGSAKNLHVL